MLAVAIAGIGPADARCTGGQTASWYGEPQRVRSGARFDPEAETCASRTEPDGTLLRVTDLDTGLGVDCAVNDYGPAASTGCQVDLSREAAKRAGVLEKGVFRAKIEVLAPPAR